MTTLLVSLVLAVGGPPPSPLPPPPGYPRAARLQPAPVPPPRTGVVVRIGPRTYRVYAQRFCPGGPVVYHFVPAAPPGTRP